MSSPVRARRPSVDTLQSPSSPNYDEYPFPRYDTSQRPASSSSRYKPRRGSIASSLHSIGGALDTSASTWSHAVSESGQNAISTLLQPPIVRTGLLPHTAAPASSAHKPPTARDIPPVTLTNIPHVEPSEFTPYLQQVGALYDGLQRAKEDEDDGGSQLFNRKGSRTDDFSDLLESAGRRKLSRQASLASLASQSPSESSSIRRRSSGGGGRRAAHAPTPLSTVPVVYFDDDFHLENPRTFDVVSERAEVVRPAPGTPDDRKTANGGPGGPRKVLATNAILQEKLSWYMDTIEIHLISSISTASSSFFAALGSLRGLHTEASESVGRIKALREELQVLDKEMAVGGLDIVNKRRRRENLKQLSDAVHQLKHIAEAMVFCESLVEDGEADKALSEIDALEKLIAGEEIMALWEDKDTPQIELRDLRSVRALQSTSADIDALRYRIGKTYETRFVDALMSDLRRHAESVQAQDTLQRWSNASQRSRHDRVPSAGAPAYLNMDSDFRSGILTNLNGLYRSHHTSSATGAYRDSVMKEFRSQIRRPLPTSNDDDNDSMVSVSTAGGRRLSQAEKSSILARNLRSLDPEDAEALLVSIYTTVGETLRRFNTQVKVLLDLTSKLGEPPKTPPGLDPPKSPNISGIEGRQRYIDSRSQEARQIQDDIHQTLDLSNLLGQAVDLAQAQVVKVLKVRTDASIRQPLERFLRYFTLNLLFANECEAISGRGGTALKTVVNGHIQDFAKHLGESERQSLAQGMESDKWNAADFTDEHAVKLSQILECSTKDPQAWTTTSNVWLPFSEAPSASQTNGGSSSVENTDKQDTPSKAVPPKTETRTATIESDTFILPPSALLCLAGITKFLHLMTGIPSITTEVSQSLVSYLQLFDSRCKQLILGAGATRSAGLKNITTKHLALASQALSFIATLIPHIREFIRRQSGSNSVSEFDRVRRSFLEHQHSIQDKLAEIMSGRANVAVKMMRQIDWDTTAPVAGASAYMETLTKETATLHRNLVKHLPNPTVLMIMEPVFSSYKKQWTEAFRDAPVRTEKGKQRMLQDAEYFKSRIDKLDGSNDTGDAVVNAVREKVILVPKQANGAETTGGAKADAASATNGDSAKPEANVPAPEANGNSKDSNDKAGS